MRQEQKGPKVVKKANLQRNKKQFVLGLIVLLFGGIVVATAMPMANIPLFSGLISRLNIPDEISRSLTLADLAAYSLGFSSDKITSAMGSNIYDNVGGLSPFGAPSTNRLLNAREAYLEEYRKTGIRPDEIAGSFSDGAELSTPDVGRGFTRGTRSTPSFNGDNPYDYNEGFTTSEFGNMSSDDVSSSTSSNLNTAMTLSNSRMVKPTSEQGFSVGGAGSVINRFMEGSISRARGRLGSMGGFNTMAQKVANSIGGRGQFNAFRTSGQDMAHAYFYSHTATTQGWKDGAKHLAEVAFDGEDVGDEVLVVPDEAQEVLTIADSSRPGTVLSAAGGNIARCRSAASTYEQTRKQLVDNYNKAKNKLLDIVTDTNNVAVGGVPGSCEQSKIISPLRKKTHELRENQWNPAVDELILACQKLQKSQATFADACNMDYVGAANIGTCENGKECCASYKALKLAGGEGSFKWSCRSHIKWKSIAYSNYWSSTKGCGKGSNEDTGVTWKRMEEEVEKAVELKVQMAYIKYKNSLVKGVTPMSYSNFKKKYVEDNNMTIEEMAAKIEEVLSKFIAGAQVSTNNGRSDCNTKLHKLFGLVGNAELNAQKDFVANAKEVIRSRNRINDSLPTTTPEEFSEDVSSSRLVYINRDDFDDIETFGGGSEDEAITRTLKKEKKKLTTQNQNKRIDNSSVVTGKKNKAQ